jgi:hypothetical protein
MRFGHWREVILALGLAAVATFGWPRPASAIGFGIFKPFPVIPREVPAVDVNTGGPYFAPPIPYGEYAKDYIGCLYGLCSHVRGCLCQLCGFCHGRGCGHCGGQGKLCSRCGGAGCGHCLGHHKDPCGLCGGRGCGHCQGGHGLFGHGRDQVVIPAGLTSSACGHCGGTGCNFCGGPGSGMVPATQAPAIPGPRVVPSGQACGACGGAGCGLCGHGRGAGICGACGGAGCGLCGGGKHRFGHSGITDPCGHCGGKGCRHCLGGGKHGLGHGKPCSHCGGRGCALCGRLNSLLHPFAGRSRYFVGAGGPVPITPGYVPYVVPVRSPRDYFAFPPFVDIDP